MSELLKPYLIRIFAFAAALAFGAVVLFNTVLYDYYLPVFPVAFFFVLSITILVHWLVIKSSETRKSRFVSTYMLANTVKLFLYIIFVGGYLFFDRNNALPFAIWFLVLYFSFTFFEILLLFVYFRQE